MNTMEVKDMQEPRGFCSLSVPPATCPTPDPAQSRDRVPHHPPNRRRPSPLFPVTSQNHLTTPNHVCSSTAQVKGHISFPELLLGAVQLSRSSTASGTTRQPAAHRSRRLPAASDSAQGPATATTPAAP